MVIGIVKVISDIPVEMSWEFLVLKPYSCANSWKNIGKNFQLDILYKDAIHVAVQAIK